MRKCSPSLMFTIRASSRRWSKKALEVVLKTREVNGLKKKPSTSELLDWLKLLMAEDIAPNISKTSNPKAGLMPMFGALLKNEQDVWPD